MSRTQPYDPSFSLDIGEGYYMNPRTREIFNSADNTVYANDQEMGMHIQAQTLGMSGDASQSSGGGAAGGVGGLASTGSGLYSMFGGGASAGAGAGTVGAGTAGAGSAAVGSSITGGTMLADGTVAPMTAGFAGEGAGAGLAGASAYALPVAAGVATVAGAQDSIRRLTDGDRTPTDWRQGANMMFGNAPTVGVYNAIGKPLGIKRDDAMRAMMLATPLAPLAVLDMMGVPVFGNNSRQHQEVLARKQNRRGLQDAGLMGPESRSIYSLADGTGFNISDHKKNTGSDAYNIDWSKNVDGDQVGLTNAIVNSIIGGKSKVRGDLSGELFNAYNSNGKFDENARAKMDAMGGRDAIYSGITQNWQKNPDKFTAQERDASLAALDKFYGVANPTGARWEDGAGLSEKEMKKNQEQLSMIPKATSAPMATTKPLPVSTMAGNRNGGRPAPAPTFRPGASVNPNFKNQPYKIPKKK